MQATKQRPVQKTGKIKNGKLFVKGVFNLPDGEVQVTVEAKPAVKFKGHRGYTPEETAQQDCPFPDESEWVEELERFHSKKNK